LNQEIPYGMLRKFLAAVSTQRFGSAIRVTHSLSDQPRRSMLISSPNKTGSTLDKGTSEWHYTLLNKHGFSISEHGVIP